MSDPLGDIEPKLIGAGDKSSLAFVYYLGLFQDSMVTRGLFSSVSKIKSPRGFILFHLGHFISFITYPDVFSASTMSQSPPAKRRKTEEPDDTGKSPPAQSTSYWFDDGSVIIQAENTQYRVHRSLLSRHSSIFNDMFSLPQPAMDPGPTSEGCPVIFLSDKATDLEHVLSVIYDGIR